MDVESTIAAYRSRIQRKARSIAYRVPSVDTQDAESYLMMALYRCIEKYDPALGEFEHFVNASLWQEANGIVHKAMKSKEAKLDRTSIDEMITPPSIEDTYDDLIEQEYYDAVANVSAKLSDVMRMVVADVDYETIARRFGHVGSKTSCELWVEIQIDKIRKALKDAM